MQWLERTIATISPRWAYNRQAWRSGMDALYDGASRNRVNMNWNPESTYDENRMRATRELMRARARDLERNSDIAQAVITAFERNVVGNGMVLQAKIPGQEELNGEIEALWKEFCKAENCDITGTQSMEEIEEMLVRRYVVDGGILIVKVYVSDSDYPFKIQVREVDELNPLATPTGSNRIIDGVEIDQYNRPVAYHFKKYRNNLAIPGESVRVDAKNVIFWWRKTSPRQVREVSMLATAMTRIKDANQFVEAVSIKERVLACLSVFIKKNTPSGSVGRAVNTPTKQLSYDGVTLSPGMIGELNPGDEVQTVIPSGQASNTKEFITTLIRLVASGIGLSYETVSRDLSMVNYSSARQGMLEDRKTFKKMQKSLVQNVLSPIYLEFLDSMFLKGKISARDYLENRRKYAAHVWIPPGYTWIDPLKEVNANKVALESNQDTLARICAERGEDWRDVVEQRMAEIQLIQKMTGGETSGEDNTSSGNDEE
ncbi:phage portal protein [Brevibacillus panacihumi]|uniref:Phage portal protein n=1 Tax=Brevibacillus panacihumi TaxID=497735 RepID=A0A3M8C9W0_9BACL|nr:phage portal protein [Brevibacillus panacihumi]RNB72167.1 phage portal protein [Brevibacillus panacihumi]